MNLVTFSFRLSAALPIQRSCPSGAIVHSFRAKPTTESGPRRPVSERSDAGTCSLTEVVD